LVAGSMLNAEDSGISLGKDKQGGRNKKKKKKADLHRKYVGRKNGSPGGNTDAVRNRVNCSHLNKLGHAKWLDLEGYGEEMVSLLSNPLFWGNGCAYEKRSCGWVIQFYTKRVKEEAVDRKS